MKAINVERGLWRTVLKRNGPLLLPAARDALNARLIERAAFFHCEKATTLPSAERDSMIFQKASAVAFFIGFDSPERKSVHCWLICACVVAAFR